MRTVHSLGLTKRPGAPVAYAECFTAAARWHALRRAWLPTHAYTLAHTTEAYAHVKRRMQARASTQWLSQGLVYDNQRRNVSYEDAQIQILPGVRATSQRCTAPRGHVSPLRPCARWQCATHYRCTLRNAVMVS